MLMITLCSSTLSRPLSAPSIVNVPRAYSPNDPDLPPAILTVCDGGVNATTVDNSTVFSEGVVLTTGSCTPANIAVASVESVENIPAVRPSCPSAANNCASRFGSQFAGSSVVGKCGAPCSSSCYPGSNGPDPNDCQFIINGLLAQSPQLFTLSQNKYLLLSHGTCGVGFQNQIAAPSVGSCPQTILYDYQDVATIANYLAWNCQGAQGARGGACRANAGLYQPSVPDFYVQVYQNAS